MLKKMLLCLAVLGLLLIPAAALAGPLFPMQLGGHYDYDGSDNLGHSWKQQVKVWAQNINIPANGQTYFHVRRSNWDPYDTTSPTNVDSLIRSDETHVYISKGGAEWLQWQTGAIGTSWGLLPSGEQAQITATPSVTVPFGTFNPSYEIKYTISVADTWYQYLYPNLGLIKTLDLWGGGPRGPVISALRAIGVDPVSFFPMKPGMLLTYNARDSLGNTWQMTKQVLEQVNIQGQAFFRVKTTNFDPINGESGGSNYFRSTEQQLFGSWDGSSADVWYQANSPGTTWTYPGEFPGWDTQATIIGLTPVQVMGGSYLAYVHQVNAVNNEYTGKPFFMYMVPGLGLAYQDDYRIDGTDTRLYFTLASITQVSASPAVSLLLD